MSARDVNQTNPKVDAFLRRATTWQQEMARLRSILLDFQLTEELKWGKPCYALGQGNVAIITPFKEYCALAFFKGALLNDPAGVLVEPGENSQGMRQMRFTSTDEIEAREPVVRAYVQEAMDVERAGLKVEFRPPTEQAVPEEFQARLDEMLDLMAAFQALTPGRQRAYLLYFAAPKQPKTRESRIDKCLPQILAGKGLND